MMESLKKAIIAGLAGTVAMTMFTYITHRMSIQGVDYHEVLSSHFQVSGPISWLFYFFVGFLFAFVYGAFVRDHLPPGFPTRGFMFAMLIWLVSSAALMPILGMGFFAGSMAASCVALVGVAIYGATVCYVYDGMPA